MRLDRKAVRIVIALLVIAVLTLAFEHMGKRQDYTLWHEVCTAWSTPDVIPGPWTDLTPVNSACTNYIWRFYPWVISFSLIVVAVLAVGGAAWVINERRN